MILSKANLEVSRVASKEKLDGGLNGVKIEKDGSTVAGNGKVMMAVGPVTYADKLHWPDTAGDFAEIGEDGIVLPLDAIEKAKKYLSKDKRIIFQHIGVTQVKDSGRIGLTSIDPSGDTTTNSAMLKKGRGAMFPKWKEVIRKVLGIIGIRKTIKVCVNRRDLMELLGAIEAACPDKGGINPVFIEIGIEGGAGLVLRCMNFETKQHSIGAITTFDTKGYWLELDAWESNVFRGQVPKNKRILRKIK